MGHTLEERHRNDDRWWHNVHIIFTEDNFT